MRDQTTNQQKVNDLRKEVRALRRYRQLVRAQGKGLSILGRISTSIFLGTGLSVAISQWLVAIKRNEGGVPIEDTANLVAALVKRVIRIGIVTITLALIPLALLLWQNLIMSDQYLALITQIEEQRAQTESLQITSYFPLLLNDDRKQFWAAVSYFASSESLTEEATSRLSRMLLESEGKGACSALEALARLSPSRPLSDGMLVRDITATLVPLLDYQKIPLGGIEIRDLECDGLRLRRAGISQLSLRDASLNNSEFVYVDLSGTSFQNSDLRGAHFLDGIQWSSEEAGRSTDFTDADLKYSLFGDEVSYIVLNGADLRGALFTWVTGNELRKSPKRFFRDALCMNPNEATECHQWHLNKFRGKAQEVHRPSTCPTEMESPIILVYGHEEERQECKDWLDDT